MFWHENVLVQLERAAMLESRVVCLSVNFLIKFMQLYASMYKFFITESWVGILFVNFELFRLKVYSCYSLLIFFNICYENTTSPVEFLYTACTLESVYLLV